MKAHHPWPPSRWLMGLMAEGLTIFAPSSAAGRAAVAVVRISGARAGAALDALDLPRAWPQPRVATRARLIDSATGLSLDDALVLWFPAPRSFTGEDMAELQLARQPRGVVVRCWSALARVCPACSSPSPVLSHAAPSMPASSISTRLRVSPTCSAPKPRRSAGRPFGSSPASQRVTGGGATPAARVGACRSRDRFPR